MNDETVVPKIRMSTEHIRSMLHRVRGIRHPCDLDLLLFFYRHPRSLLTSELLVSFLGYDRERVAKSLDGLIEAGLLTRSPNPAHAARLYLLNLHGSPDGSLAPLLKIATTRVGRLTVIQALQPAANGAPVALAGAAAAIAKIA